jgi:hypothetical protein
VFKLGGIEFEQVLMFGSAVVIGMFKCKFQL